MVLYPRLVAALSTGVFDNNMAELPDLPIVLRTKLR